MKKTILFFASVIMMSTTVMADNEWFYIFRNDKNFNSSKTENIKSVEYEKGADDSFSTMKITDIDDNVTTVDMSAVDSCVVRPTGLPIIYVNLTGQYSTLEDLIKNQPGFDKSTIYDATLSMDGNGMYEDIPETTVEFRGRGNSTWNMSKTPYRFKLPKKQAVCGLPKAKSFALIANYIDCSLMRNAVALKVAQMLGMPFTNHSVPVVVYLNGYYKGAYMLTEKIGIGGGSVDIDEENGILWEMDSNYDEAYQFKYTWRDGYYNKTLPVMVKDPDLDEIAAAGNTTASELFNNWKTDFTKMADAVVSGNFSDQLDMQSVVNFLIVNNFACNCELRHPKSCYLYKNGSNDKYHFGPVWDFDWSFTFDGAEDAPYNSVLFASDGDYAGASFFKLICKNDEFMTLYRETWNKFVSEQYPLLLEYMEDYIYLIEPSAKENGLRWPADHSVSWRLSESSYDIRNNYEKLKTWIQNRVNYISNHKNLALYE